MKKLLRIIFICVPFVLINYPRILYYSIRKKHISKVKIYQYAQWFLRKLLHKLGMDLEIRNKENVPCTSSFLMVGNHQSLMDPLVLIASLEGPLSFVAKKELKKIIGVNSFINMVNGLFMDRHSLKNSVSVMKEVKASLHEDNMIWCIFPEGTRTKEENKEVGKFLGGSLKMAMSEEKMIVPFVLDGGYDVLPLKGKWKIKTILKILKPIPYEEYKNYSTNELAQMIEDKIRSEHHLLYQEIHQEK